MSNFNLQPGITVDQVGASISGGAGRAMARITEAIQLAALDRNFPIRFRSHFGHKENAVDEWRQLFEKNLRRGVTRGLFQSGHRTLHSVAAVRTGLGRHLNRLAGDIVHLHWLGDATISIEEIAEIKAPIVWTMHDMWPILGSEHHSPELRFIEGYTTTNRSKLDRGPDVPRYTWQRKVNFFPDHLSAVSPSKWLADAVGASYLGREWDVSVIPNPIDVDFWSPIPRQIARKRLGIPEDALLLLFGASGGFHDPNKGGVYYLDMLSWLRRFAQEPSAGSYAIWSLTFGGHEQPATIEGITTLHFDEIGSDSLLRLFYSAADVTAVPSVIDNFPSVATESMSCGTPVVGFEGYGVAEIVDHEISGMIFPHGRTELMAKEIDRNFRAGLLKEMGLNGRKKAEQLWNPMAVGMAYIDLYIKTVNTWKR